MRFNPFKPGSIVGPGIFSGRLDELSSLDGHLFQTKHGNPQHFLIHGERGIGKSSLMLVTKIIASGDIKGIDSDCNFNFLTVEVDIQPSTTFESLTLKVGSDLSKQVSKLEQFKTAAVGLWNFLKNWEVLGVKYNKESSDGDPVHLLEDLCDTLIKVAESCGDKIDGILILVDEADKASDVVDLGVWVKSLTERLAKRGCHRVCLGLCGISSVIEVLKASHESSPRVFQHMLLEPLSHAERLQVIQAGLVAAKEINKVESTIHPDAADWIAKYSEGFPHFIQQYAYSAFESDVDDIIDMSDVKRGASKENGALDQLGTRYFEDMYRAQINSDEYRKVLQAIATSPEKYVSKQDIRKLSGLKETTLGNALQSLKNKQIILAHPEKQGHYKLPSDSFGVWIRAQVDRQANNDHMKAF